MSYRRVGSSPTSGTRNYLRQSQTAMLYLLIVVFFILLSFFIFPSLSSVPYYPSNSRDAKNILGAIDMAKVDCVIDMGAGDGWVVFASASEAYSKKLHTKFVAVEINPALVVLLHMRRLFHPNRHAIHIIRADMFTVSLDAFASKEDRVCAYLYISPWLLKKAVGTIRAQHPHARIVTYMYGLSEHAYRVYTGIHPTYLYTAQTDRP